MTPLITVLFAVVSLIALGAAAHLVLWSTYRPATVARLARTDRAGRLMGGGYAVACAIGWGALVGCGTYVLLWWLPGSIGGAPLRGFVATAAGLVAGVGLPAYFFAQAAKTPNP